MVFYKGKLIRGEQRVKPAPCPPELTDTIHLGKIDPEKLKIRLDGHPFPVIRMIPGQILTERRDLLLPGKEYFEADGNLDKIAVFERHKATGKTSVGVVQNFGLREGAIASSVSHDSHNIIVIGDNDRDILLAVKELERTHGGYTIIRNGEVCDTLELPIMGLISDRSYSYVNQKLRKMIRQAHRMGVPEDMDPFITLSFMALPVIPEIRCTPRGIYRVTGGEFLRRA